MKRLSFFAKLKKEKRLMLVEESEEISKSYTTKSENCLKSAKILFEENLFENATAEAYYAMYNSVLALFFRCGIKCENHAAAVILLGKLFNAKNLKAKLKKAKKERIDKQYYISEKPEEKLTKEQTEQLIKDAEEFILEIKMQIGGLNSDIIKQIRDNFDNLK